MSRTLTELLSLVDRIPELYERVKRIEDRLNNADQHRELPEWTTLRQAAAFAGIPYSTLRRPENAHLRPGTPAGTPDAIISGVRRYRRKTIEGWVAAMGKDRR